MTSGLETLLISGGTQVIVQKLAEKGYEEAAPRIESSLRNLNINSAQHQAREEEIEEAFYTAIEEVADEQGVEIDTAQLRYSVDTESADW